VGQRLGTVVADVGGPYAAIHTSSAEVRAHGNCSVVPLCSTARQLASSRITWVASRRSFNVVGLPFRTRTAESPRPMPHTVRLPYISLRVAKTDAVTVQSRVAGLVTIGPTVIRFVAARIAE